MKTGLLEHPSTLQMEITLTIELVDKFYSQMILPSSLDEERKVTLQQVQKHRVCQFASQPDNKKAYRKLE